jgi:hypothetical protein
MTAELLQPLVAADVDLRDFGFMPLDVLRLRDSDLAALSNGEEFKAAVLLWCAAWHQVPAGSLPADDRLLARYSGAMERWRKVKDGALRGFVHCADGRLYHPVIAEKAVESWSAKQRQRERTAAATAAREAKRRAELAQRDEARDVERNDKRDEPRNEQRDVERDVERDVVQGTVKGQGQGQGQGKKENPSRPAAGEVASDPPPDPGLTAGMGLGRVYRPVAARSGVGAGRESSAGRSSILARSGMPDAGEGFPDPPPDPGRELWANAVQMLRDQGLSETSARSFIGLQCRTWDEDTVADAFSAAAGQANVKAYVLAVLKGKPKKGEKPAGVEFRNGQATIGGFVP